MLKVSFKCVSALGALMLLAVWASGRECYFHGGTAAVVTPTADRPSDSAPAISGINP